VSVRRALFALVPRLRGTRVGSGTYVSPLATLREHGRIALGARGMVGRHVELRPQGGFIHIGDDCSLNNHVVMYGHGGITVHDGCRIATGVVVVAFNHSFADPDLPIRSQPLTAHGVVIGPDAWIGARAIVLDGVTVGRGSVVGAGAVVTRDVPEFAIVAGNPARVLRRRAVPQSDQVSTTVR
jgi:acetyltransferase-like isoleucine patch superfamily enzyme